MRGFGFGGGVLRGRSNSAYYLRYPRPLADLLPPILPPPPPPTDQRLAFAVSAFLVAAGELQAPTPADPEPGGDDNLHMQEID